MEFLLAVTEISLKNPPAKIRPPEKPKNGQARNTNLDPYLT